MRCEMPASERCSERVFAIASAAARTQTSSEIAGSSSAVAGAGAAAAARVAARPPSGTPQSAHSSVVARYSSPHSGQLTIAAIVPQHRRAARRAASFSDGAEAMKLLWFHLMPYTQLPADFAEQHPSVWVDIDSRL